jgi:hypothetical protein
VEIPEELPESSTRRGARLDNVREAFDRQAS